VYKVGQINKANLKVKNRAAFFFFLSYCLRFFVHRPSVEANNTKKKEGVEASTKQRCFVQKNEGNRIEKKKHYF